MLRYYPPGIVMDTINSNGETEVKSIDLLDLKDTYVNFNINRSDPEYVASSIILAEPLFPTSKTNQLVKMITSILHLTNRIKR